jgi:hypothetical protein
MIYAGAAMPQSLRPATLSAFVDLPQLVVLERLPVSLIEQDSQGGVAGAE